MEMPTINELRERYRGLCDDELLVLAADSASLTPEADGALKQEVARRGLTEADVNETSARLIKSREKDKEIQRALFDFRPKLEYAFRSLFLGALMLALWWPVSLWQQRSLSHLRPA